MRGTNFCVICAQDWFLVNKIHQLIEVKEVIEEARVLGDLTLFGGLLRIVATGCDEWMRWYCGM